MPFRIADLEEKLAKQKTIEETPAEEQEQTQEPEIPDLPKPNFNDSTGILAPLNGDPLYIIPCLFFNKKTKHIFPYRINFLLPQLFGYADTLQSTVCLSYIRGRDMQLETITASAKKSLEQILKELDYRPIKQLLNPIENKLLPKATLVPYPLFQTTRLSTLSDSPYYRINSNLVLNRYIVYYQTLYNNYRPAIQSALNLYDNRVQFLETYLTDMSQVIVSGTLPRSFSDVQTRVKMLENLSRNRSHSDIAATFEYTQYGETIRNEINHVPMALDKFVAWLWTGCSFKLFAQLLELLSVLLAITAGWFGLYVAFSGEFLQFGLVDAIGMGIMAAIFGFALAGAIFYASTCIEDMGDSRGDITVRSILTNG
jgi:hypothetical protein